MPGLLADLVDELRTVGIPVSVGEHLDAASAVSWRVIQTPCSTLELNR